AQATRRDSSFRLRSIYRPDPRSCGRWSCWHHAGTRWRVGRRSRKRGLATSVAQEAAYRSVPVPMMDVGEMRMGMRQRLVRMPMRVRLGAVPWEIVRVPMMLVVLVRVIMDQSFVRM